MEQIVRVQAVSDDGTAQVLHIRRSACSGDCHRCAGCGAVEQKMLLTAENPLGAVPGDLVVITSRSGPVLRAALVLYGLPVAAFFAGCLLGAAAGAGTALFGCLSFAAGLGLAVLYDRRVCRKQKQTYIISRYAADAAGSL